jgi:hypothetical protein
VTVRSGGSQERGGTRMAILFDLLRAFAVLGAIGYELGRLAGAA